MTKRISPISYENGHEDGYTKGREAGLREAVGIAETEPGRPSQRKRLLIEACFIKDCPPFIYGVNGHATISAIEEMEEQLQEDAADVEDGTYLYECYHEAAEYGFEGRMEQAAYWQMDQLGYWPLEEDALHPATEE